ncbi:MAG: DUF1559 domain-containing protein [Pirellulales bacterium]|nr:DUF1559 domain-containing protein [Pirellulales bacterium]
MLELLVTTTIMGLLVSLVLAAVQATRESSRNTACRANLAQVAKALQLFEGRMQHGFPRRVDTLGGRAQSWVVHILPFLDDNASHDLMKSGANGERYVELLVCPSDPPQTRDATGWLSYVANCGGVVDQTTWERMRANGVFHRTAGPQVSVDYLNHHDGASYTALVSENIQAGRWTHTSRSLVGFVWRTGDAPSHEQADVGTDEDDSQELHEGSESESSACELDYAEISDDGHSGYTTIGSWVRSSGSGAYSDFERASAGSNCTATWTFSQLSPGRYQVWATWQSYPSCATNASFLIGSGEAPLAVQVDQSDPPRSDVVDSGIEFQLLGSPVETSNGELSISISAAAADGFVIADAIRIECVGALEGNEEPSDESDEIWLQINDDKHYDGGADLAHARPSSFHKGGVNIAMCDGRVLFVRQTIDYHVYRQLMTPFGNGSDAKDNSGAYDPTLDLSALER